MHEYKSGVAAQAGSRRRGRLGMAFCVGTIAAAVITATPGRSAADTLLGALTEAYQVNPQLNAQRAIVRQTDEAVPQALSGYRPSIKVNAGVGKQVTSQETIVGPALVQRDLWPTTPSSVGITVQQTLFNGFQTANQTRAAESNVFVARETLRVIEQTVLLDAATVYLDVVRDAAILAVQQSNVRMLGDILQQTRARFKLQEVTRTDVAQAEAQLAAGQSQMLGADSNLTTSKAAYRRVIGSEPGRLEPGLSVERLSPQTLAAAIDAGTSANPSVLAARYGVDVAQLQVKISESSLYPTVTLLGSAQYLHDVPFTGLIPEQSSATALITVSVPLYQGGAEYSAIRQSKETLTERRLDLATTRDKARATVVQVWGEIRAAKAQVQAAQEQVRAAEVAVNGVRTEARLGLRTTLDVLIDQQALVNARLNLVTAEHDRIVGSYKLLSAVGRLSPQTLGLRGSIYDPTVHYQQVRDAWAGLRTPDGQ
jgi:outer membrane protein